MGEFYDGMNITQKCHLKLYECDKVQIKESFTCRHKMKCFGMEVNEGIKTYHTRTDVIK